MLLPLLHTMLLRRTLLGCSRLAVTSRGSLVRTRAALTSAARGLMGTTGVPHSVHRGHGPGFTSELMARWGNRVGTGYPPSGLIHCCLQQLEPCLPLQRTSHTQDLQMPARRLAPTIREHSPGLILDELFSRGGDVLLSPSAWPGENCGSPRGAVAWGGGLCL